MRPAHLKSPFTWDQRCVTIHDRVWYIPKHFHSYESFKFPGWQHPDLFTHERPIKIEYCSGNGAWIESRALSEPHVNWVAVEKKFERVRKIWSKIKNHQMDNLIAVCGEGRLATELYFPCQSVAEVYVNFPDPWPKTRHFKHRIVEGNFVKEVHRILQTGGTFTLATDDTNYSAVMIAVLSTHAGFESAIASPYFTHEWPNYGNSFFEKMWRQQGKQIYYHQFRKKG
jgi:tRNA (guanine-N7-)-methyltransferase